jgi:hypothetical protein
MLPRPAAKQGASGSSRRPPRSARPTVQYFSCTRCATAPTPRPPRRRRPQLDVVRLLDGPAVELVDFVGVDPHLPELRDHVPHAERPAAPIVRDLVPPGHKPGAPARPVR